MSNKDDEVSSVFYIEGGAFPVCVLVEEGLSVVVPTTDYIVGQTTYKWGATNPKAECIAADIIIDFSNGRGFYSSGNLNGNAATATKLQTARTINGVTFDGTTDISLTPENIGALSLSGGTLLGGLTAPLLTTKSDLIFSSHTSRHIRFTYTKNDGTTLTDGYIFKDGVDNPNRRPGIRINCAAPNKETGNGTNSGDWIFGEDGIFTMPGGTVLRGGINSNGVPQSEYKHDMLTSVVDDAKMYLRRFRSSTGASIWHETIENNVYRLCTGTTDAQEELVLRTGSYAKFAGEIISKSANGLRIAYGNYGFFIRNDGSNTYFMLTDSGNSLGTYNRLRPLIINNANGAVTIGNGLNVTGGINGSLNGNAATATKLQTARTIGGVSFDGSANIDLPGVNKTGNQNTTGNAATATKLQTARTINGVSFDGSKNIELTAEDLNLEQTVELAAGALQKNQNGADIPGKDTFTKNIGACRAFHSSISTGAGNWTTAQLIEWLDSQGAFNHPYWMCKCSWSYGNNKIITDTGCGTIHLAGCVIEVMGNKGAMTIRVTTPSTSTGGGTTNAQFTYINHGDAYAPGWRRDYNTKNQQPAFALGQTGSIVGNDKAVGWNSISGVYNANIGGASTLILHFYMGAGSCPAVQFRVNYKNGGIYYRSARDGYGFEADWSEFYTTTRKPSAGDVGAYTKAECDSRFITGIRLGTKSSVQTWNGPGWNDKSGYVVTASINSNKDELIDTTQARPVQYCINGTWYNAGSI
ncbi:TPA: tail fiber protein [Shigella boydii]